VELGPKNRSSRVKQSHVASMILLMILSYLIKITTFVHHFFFFFSEGTYIEIYRETLNCLDVYTEILLGEKDLSPWVVV